ncbi:LOW QUALITY PROTEIN: SLD2 DNA replication regulator SLD2 [Candida maltosa Xu316]
MDINEIKQKIKKWEYSFKEKHNRLPSKSDIKDNNDIYKLYSSMKSGKQPVKTTTESTSKDEMTSPVKPKTNTIQGELGPTPQANGRVMSIFDFKMTPPESSPLKNKSTNILNSSPPKFAMLPPMSPVKKIAPPETPTKRRRLSFSVTPTKPIPINFETPSYLTRHKENPQTPTSTTAQVDFKVSPSPFKPLRGIGHRLADLYNRAIEEAKDLKMNEEYVSEGNSGSEDEIDDESTARDGSSVVYRKKRTQKRSTRRVKMAPRQVDGEDKLQDVNVLDQMTKIEEHERKRLEAYINSDEEDEEEDKSNVFDTSSKKTRKPIAANYKRLKINDPRSKRFKQRMRRR